MSLIPTLKKLLIMMIIIVTTTSTFIPISITLKLTITGGRKIIIMLTLVSKNN
jgi:hypothetical protein